MLESDPGGQEFKAYMPRQLEFILPVIFRESSAFFRIARPDANWPNDSEGRVKEGETRALDLSLRR